MSEEITNTQTTAPITAGDGIGLSEQQTETTQEQNKTATEPIMSSTDAENNTDTLNAEAGEEIAYDFKMPDGFEMNDDQVNELKPLLSKFKVGKEDAQALVDMHIKAIQNQQKQARDAWLQQEKGWLETVGKDPELGNQTNQAMALQAMKEFASPELRTLLEETRLGSHPEMVRLFIKIGKSISEDSAVVGTAGNAPKLARDETGSPMLTFSSMK